MATAEPGRSAQTLQGVIDRVAEQSAGRPISVVRDRLVEALHANGFTPPSESWVDAVAREAVHGRTYAVSLETLAGYELATAQDRQLEDAPAELPVTSAATPAGPAPLDRPLPGSAAAVSPPAAGSTRWTTGRLLALAGLLLVIVGWRRSHRPRPTSGDADG